MPGANWEIYGAGLTALLNIRESTRRNDVDHRAVLYQRYDTEEWRRLTPRANCKIYRGASRHDQTFANRDGNSLRAVCCTEFPAGHCDVFLDGALGNPDNCTDLPR